MVGFRQLSDLACKILAGSAFLTCGHVASGQDFDRQPDYSLGASVGQDPGKDPPSGQQQAELTDLSVLPEPGEAPDAGYGRLIGYVLAVADKATENSKVESALVDPSSIALIPRRQVCLNQPLAILVDLDGKGRAFDVNDPPTPFPGLAGQLQNLRERGVSVIWLTSLSSDSEGAVRVRLVATELFSMQNDKLLTVGPSSTKQAARLAASRQSCIVAIAGDELSDFDEAFGYLRDMTGPIGQALLANLGQAWFFTPLPID